MIIKTIPIVCIFLGFLVSDNMAPKKNIDIGNQNKSSAPGSDANAFMYIGQS